MNNDIQESYCSFEVSKLLKEKGFGVPVLWNYSKVNDYVGIGSGIPASNWNELVEDHMEEVELFSRPTHALAIEWLRVNHYGLYITINIIDNEFFYEIRRPEWDGDSAIMSEEYPTPQETTEAALLYTLKNLI